MRIAIIDSGINPDHPHVGGIAGGVCMNGGDCIDRLGHGTAVAGAIREKAPNVQLFAVKVFDRTLSAKIGTIIRAIEWSLDQRADIMNLSLGTRNPAHRPLFEQVLAGTQAVVVTAADLLPGSIDGVIGVALDWDCPRDEYQVDMRNGRPIFRASGFPRSIPGVPREKNLSGISFAVANMTGLVAREMATGATAENLRVKLIERAAKSRVA
jgi:hypothetical protein